MIALVIPDGAEFQWVWVICRDRLRDLEALAGIQLAECVCVCLWVSRSELDV